MIEPLMVFDARDKRWHGDVEALCAWSSEQGIDPDLVYRLEVYLVDCPFARVYEYVTDPENRRFFVPDGDEYLRRDPYDVVVSSLPPMAET